MCSPTRSVWERDEEKGREEKRERDVVCMREPLSKLGDLNGIYIL